MSGQIKKGLLRDNGNFIVNSNALKVILQEKGMANIVSESEMVKIEEYESEDFWVVTERPSIGNNNYINFKATIKEKINGLDNIRKLFPNRQANPYNPEVFEHYISFERLIKKNEIISITYSYNRQIKEIITEKGLFYRNRVILYTNSFSIPCNNVTVEIVPEKKFFKNEIRKNYHCENIHSKGDVFYIDKITKHHEYVILQFLSWKILPPFVERLTWKLITNIGSAILAIILTLMFNDQINNLIKQFFSLFKQK